MSHAHRHLGADRIEHAEMPRPRVDMNLTPLIDILLVLLVIFMAALPLTQKAIDSQLPSRTESPAPGRIDTRIVLEYAADGRISVNHQDVVLEQLETRLRAIDADRRDKTMFIAGVPSLPYRAIVAAMDAAKGAGVDRVGIMTGSLARTENMR